MFLSLAQMASANSEHLAFLQAQTFTNITEDSVATISKLCRQILTSIKNFIIFSQNSFLIPLEELTSKHMFSEFS